MILGLLVAAPATASHLSLYLGGGLGFFATGGPGISDSNSHKLGGVGFHLWSDRLELRIMRGSLERTDLPIDGDNDADYQYVDLLLGRRLTGLPVDLGLGYGQYRQHLPEGYPDRIGPRVEFTEYGPHLAVKRDFKLWHALIGWTELDVNYAPFRREEVFVTGDVGLGLRF
jgi:hypothetical protein